MRLKYNAPTILTFTFISVLVLILSSTLLPSLTKSWFMVPGKGSFVPFRIRSWVTLVTHVLGHANWTHLIANFSLILLIGPILEERYGSWSLLEMIFLTALVTGVLNVFLFSKSLLGASGVAFMMILLASFTNFKKGEIPLTFVLIVVLYLGRELFNSLVENTISEFAHIIGGFCGSLFGFFKTSRTKP